MRLFVRIYNNFSYGTIVAFCYEKKKEEKRWKRKEYPIMNQF